MSSMHYDATPEAFRRARDLRERETPAEKLLWEILSRNQLLGFRFRRQHPIAIYIVDFYCHRAKLVIELDGASHKDQQEYDATRTTAMNEFGVEVIRFRNADVLGNINSVREKILEVLSARPKRKLGRGL
jgi:very-short-patch-repair endonuclease